MSATRSARHPLLGAHVSIAGGVGEALIRGKALGCECIQIFTKSSRQWKSRPYTGDEIAAFKRNRKETGIDSIIAHNSYLLNLGSPDEPLRKKSVAAFIDELERCELLGIPYLVAHPGSHVGAGEAAGIRTIAKSIDEAHCACGGLRVRNMSDFACASIPSTRSPPATTSRAKRTIGGPSTNSTNTSDSDASLRSISTIRSNRLALAWTAMNISAKATSARTLFAAYCATGAFSDFRCVSRQSLVRRTGISRLIGEPFGACFDGALSEKPKISEA